MRRGESEVGGECGESAGEVVFVMKLPTADIDGLIHYIKGSNMLTRMDRLMCDQTAVILSGAQFKQPTCIYCIVMHARI